MKLTIVSQNVQGMNDGTKTDVIRNYYRPLLCELDVVCLQELKLRGAQLQAA